MFTTFVTSAVMTSFPLLCILAPHSASFVIASFIAPGMSVTSSPSFVTMFTTSFPAASSILGIPVINPVTIAIIILGIAATNSGTAVMIPSTSATTISPALSKISGIPSTNALIMAVMISGNF